MHASQFGRGGKKCSQQRLEVRARTEDLNTFTSLEEKTDEEKGREEARNAADTLRPRDHAIPFNCCCYLRRNTRTCAQHTQKKRRRVYKRCVLQTSH